jgi:transcriptional regulator with GAF, ATPase, and Fis domain
MSPLAGAPFIKVNCAAIPGELIESELFGYERGAFTGAHGRKPGQFELADGGTLFLDEIGDMSLSAQAKVLRVLQSGELTRVGGQHTITVDVRVIAATNRDLEEAVSAGTFREDLYFRLNVLPLQAPPLRDRLTDVPLLLKAFIERFCKDNGYREKPIDDEALRRLAAYNWPGNVRELKNIAERLVIMSGDEITLADLPESIAGVRPAPAAPRFQGPRPTLKDFRESAERQFVLETLEENDWNISRTAQLLGIERTNLHKKIKALGLNRKDYNR